MGCKPSKLQDMVMQEEYNYRRPIWNKSLNLHIDGCDFDNSTCVTEGDDRENTHIDKGEHKGSISKDNESTTQNYKLSRLSESNQDGFTTHKIYADNKSHEHEDRLITLQTNIDEVKNTSQNALKKLSHTIDHDDRRDMVNGINQDLLNMNNFGNKSVNQTSESPKEADTQLNTTKKKEDQAEPKRMKTNNQHDNEIIDETSEEADTENVQTQNNSRSMELSEGTNLKGTESQNNSYSQEEPATDVHSNKATENMSHESKQAEETVQESENETETAGDKETVKKPEPLTKEQSEAVSMMYYDKIKMLVDTMKDKDWITEDGSVADGVCFLLDVLKNSYSGLYQIRALFNYIKEFRVKVAKLMLDTKTAEKICEVVVHACDKMPVSKYRKAHNEFHPPVHSAMHVFGNFTDASPALAERIANYPGFLAAQRKIQKDFTDREFNEPQPAQDESDCGCGKCIVSSSLCMIHNISMAESTIPLLRGHNFVEVLQPYLKSKDKEDHLAALATLAAIVDEKESAIINSNKKVVKYLMKTLKYGMRKEERRFNGWSCKECGLTIKILARNDANKKLLVQLGALKLLVKLAKGNTEEQIEAAGALWTLSFDEDNRKEMVENKKLRVISRLSDLKDSDIDKIKKAATGALWNLREDLRKSDDPDYQELGKGFVADVTDKAVIQKRLSRETLKIPTLAGQGHIFISYQWTNQRILIDIRNELIKNGHKVWMDVDNMQGSTLQAMAEAVEDADMVLVCFSQKYKNSPNCRAEAEYTFQRQKPIIPLRMETNYKPDGWLGILVGTKLFYDFSGKYNFQDKLNKLIKDITAMKSDMLHDETPKIVEPLYHSVDRVDAPIVRQAPETLKSSATTDSAEVKSWTDDDVRNWIQNHNLPEAECSSFTCDEICLLLKMMNEAPESFYKGLQRKFNYDFKIISQLVKALEAINTH